MERTARRQRPSARMRGGRRHRPHSGNSRTWTCSRCGNFNWGDRQRCAMRKCNALRPGFSVEDTPSTQERPPMPGNWAAQSAPNLTTAHDMALPADLLWQPGQHGPDSLKQQQQQQQQPSPHERRRTPSKQSRSHAALHFSFDEGSSALTASDPADEQHDTGLIGERPAPLSLPGELLDFAKRAERDQFSYMGAHNEPKNESLAPGHGRRRSSSRAASARSFHSMSGLSNASFFESDFTKDEVESVATQTPTPPMSSLPSVSLPSSLASLPSRVDPLSCPTSPLHGEHVGEHVRGDSRDHSLSALSANFYPDRDNPEAAEQQRSRGGFSRILSGLRRFGRSKKAPPPGSPHYDDGASYDSSSSSSAKDGRSDGVSTARDKEKTVSGNGGGNNETLARTPAQSPSSARSHGGHSGLTLHQHTLHLAQLHMTRLHVTTLPSGELAHQVCDDDNRVVCISTAEYIQLLERQLMEARSLLASQQRPPPRRRASQISQRRRSSRASTHGASSHEPPYSPFDEWQCKECGNHNRHYRMHCNMRRCRAPRHDVPQRDWRCECGNSNFWHRTICNMRSCLKKRPLDAEILECDTSPSQQRSSRGQASGS
ncbi:MAG: hypothetical protein MHM6MM_001188 [Cercozoa sp. M6MM]